MRSRRRTFWPASSSATTAPAGAKCAQPRWTATGGFAPALETELRNQLKQRADAESIRVFAENLRQLLLAPPLGAQNILAVDPGFRTGCKNRLPQP